MTIDPGLRAILVCPACRAALEDTTAPDGGAELSCTDCGLIYPVNNGIPELLVDRARRA